MPVKPKCTHKDKKLQCTLVTMNDLLKFHNSFYKITDKIKQDYFLLKHVKANKTKRRRPRSAGRNYKARNMQFKYLVYCILQRKVVQVCQKAFLQILHVKKYRIENIVTKVKKY